MRRDTPIDTMRVLACLLLALAARPCHASILDNAWRLLWPFKQQETVHVVFSNHLVRPPRPPHHARSGFWARSTLLDDSANIAAACCCPRDLQRGPDTSTARRAVQMFCEWLHALPWLQDIGFDGISPEAGTDDNVINRYFDVYFPRAIETANALKAQNADLSYVWTTQVGCRALQQSHQAVPHCVQPQLAASVPLPLQPDTNTN